MTDDPSALRNASMCSISPGPYALMRSIRALAASLTAGVLAVGPASAIESQALATAAALPPQVRQVFACGEWATGGATGYFRVILAEVSFGAGTEVYIQRIRDGEVPKVIETTPVRELNDDHAQYLVSTAKCVGSGRKASVELMAIFEHDTGDEQHAIRIGLGGPGAYSVADKSIRPRRK